MTRNDLIDALWAEQIARGIGDPAERNQYDINDWLAEHTAIVDDINAATCGDIAALARVRVACGLPIL